jgi:hypothetical protein
MMEVENAQLQTPHFGCGLRAGALTLGATHDTAYAGANEVWSENAQGNTVSVAGCTWKEKMPNAWRGSGQRSSIR